MILASTLICAVSATHTSRTTAEVALEFRKANELTAYLLESSPDTPGETSGRLDGFNWTRAVAEPVSTFGPSAICERHVIVTATRDGREFETRGNAVCPAALAS